MRFWCLNGLEVTGPENDVQAFSIDAVGEEHTCVGRDESRSILAFHQLEPLPLPQQVLEKPCPEQDLVVRKKVEAMLEEELTPPAEVARLDTLNAELAMWGASGARETRIIARETGRITYLFETAWNPPILLLRRIGMKYPTLTFQLAFAEPGNDVRGLVYVRRDHTLAESGVGTAPPDEKDYDEVAFEEALEDYFAVYDDHVWALVRSEPG